MAVPGASLPGKGVLEALERAVSALPGGGEARPGQRRMAEAVAAAIAARGSLLVQAGTGTGKTLAYLVPAIVSGRPTVVATATKALQDQLAGKDLPFLEEHLGRPVRWAVLKGRSNYLCRQRVRELGSDDGEQLGLDGVAERAPADELRALARWSERAATGDRADLEAEPSDAAWAAVSVSARECPGASRCPSGASCFAEAARDRATRADVVVVNLHLYGLHLAAGGGILPEHDVVVIDEAHQLEEVISATSGVELGPRRFADLARRSKGVIADDQLAAGAADAGSLLATALGPYRGERLRGGPPEDLGGVLMVASGRVERVLAAARAVPDDAPEAARSRAARLQHAAASLLDDLAAVQLAGDGDVVWVEGPEHAPALRVAPVDVAELLREGLWGEQAVVLTSATIPERASERLGAPDRSELLDVGSPFDYAANALLYCAAQLPDPRSEGHVTAMVEELGDLIEAAGGRTLALFTSYRSMDEAAARLRARLDVAILTQRDLPKPRLVERFTAELDTCLFATMGFWQGIDVPGPALSLVAIDRLPFSRPDEPLVQARRERAGQRAFELIDLPRASTLLAQGAGRLIRTARDRGVVAVLDPRLATARYRWDIVNALPPMRRTKDPAEARRFLQELRA